MRKSEVERKTNETQVEVSLDLQGTGKYDNRTGVEFFNHMLDLLAKHGMFDLTVVAKGDLEVDAHHTIEDVGLVLGEAFSEALADKRGIRRYGWSSVPMDETLALAAVDFGGRSYCVVDVPLKRETIGDFPSELLVDFFEAFSRGAKAAVHVKIFYGRNDHHKVEACFKAFAKACQLACEFGRTKDLPSTKGLL
ncbi:imidazoleglycerol-phosphate dehydratase HisB [Candidatus Micrarchaeota archaeon]|nr:imidazoleglycerol-phosphate dehydratase HisB [Candidatus Micrarchaeota archaeon]